MVYAFSSHGRSWWFDLRWGHASQSAIGMDPWLLLELGEERQPNVILIAPSSVLTGQENLDTSIMCSWFNQWHNTSQGKCAHLHCPLFVLVPWHRLPFFTFYFYIYITLHLSCLYKHFDVTELLVCYVLAYRRKNVLFINKTSTASYCALNWFITELSYIFIV